MTNFDKILKNFEKYDYRKAVFNDVKDEIQNWFNYHKNEVKESEKIEDLKDQLNENFWTDDSITGNASGSYWFSAWKAEIALVGNSALYKDALEEFGGEFEESPETRDVTIRCYLLSPAIDEALEDEEIIKIYDEIKGA